MLDVGGAGLGAAAAAAAVDAATRRHQPEDTGADEKRRVDFAFEAWRADEGLILRSVLQSALTDRKTRIDGREG